MSNEYFNATGSPATSANGSSAVMRSEFLAIAAGFDKLPTLTGAGNRVVHVNAGGTALTTTSGFSFSGTVLTVPGMTVTDSTFSIADNSDATKIAQFECSSITTGTTRTYTLPNASVTLAGLTLATGGTNANLTASNGGIVYSDASALAILSATATAGRMLRSGSNAAPTWSTATFPSTATSTGTILRANGTNWAVSSATYPDTISSGQILRASGVNTIEASAATYPNTVSGAGYIIRASGANVFSTSTATFPDAATGTGTILRADGTNWVASTSSYPDTISTGQILRASSANSVAASTMTYPDTITSGYVPYATGTNALGSSSLLTATGDGTGSTSGMTITGTYSGLLTLLTLRNDNNIAKLVVSGNGTSQGGRIELINTASPTTSAMLYVNTDGSSNSIFAISKNSNTVFYVDNGDNPYFPGHDTTASGANAYLESGGSPVGELKRSTSSLRYKREVESADAAHINAVLRLEPIWYRSKCAGDNPDWSWWGLGAEDVAAVDPRLVHWTPEILGHDEHGQPIRGDRLVPDGVMYERVAVLTLGVVKIHETRLNNIEQRLQVAGI